MAKQARRELFPKKYGFFPYVFLIYLIMPAVLLLEEEGAKQVFGYLLLLLFLISYHQLFHKEGTRMFSYWLGVQMGIICFQSIAYDYNFLFLGFFAASFIGWYGNKRNFRIGWSALFITLLLPIMYHMIIMEHVYIIYIIPFMIVILASPFGIRSVNKNMQLEKELDEANAKIEELIKREERTRIAQDLHDTLGHTLSLLTLKSQLVERLITKDAERAKKEVKEIETTSRAALDQVRELVTDMKAQTLKEELIQVEQLLDTANIDIHMQFHDNIRFHSAVTEHMLSLCLKEAVTNIVKHSQASKCWLELKENDRMILLCVKDNGVGMSTQGVEGYGLQGIKERLALLGGTLSLITNSGTTLEMTVPKVKRPEGEGKLYV
ncbi:sensor histidine kinase [Virgibacillus proomii]|uniref:sensor histidine kinase n=1 Tax=Virgibacillus proomii TaxID=84407 RepID=UPI001C117062|nr:sensor histidine kinase [Virgibacillus proomii]MBU5266666.1 sensor histidine kinase [Virgibacillus proomii]